jgi:hypothetical protein
VRLIFFIFFISSNILLTKNASSVEWDLSRRCSEHWQLTHVPCFPSDAKWSQKLQKCECTGDGGRCDACPLLLNGKKSHFCSHPVPIFGTVKREDEKQSTNNIDKLKFKALAYVHYGAVLNNKACGARNDQYQLADPGGTIFPSVNGYSTMTPITFSFSNSKYKPENFAIENDWVKEKDLNLSKVIYAESSKIRPSSHYGIQPRLELTSTVGNDNATTLQWVLRMYFTHKDWLQTSMGSRPAFQFDTKDGGYKKFHKIDCSGCSHVVWKSLKHCVDFNQPNALAVNPNNAGICCINGKKGKDGKKGKECKNGGTLAYGTDDNLFLNLFAAKYLTDTKPPKLNYDAYNLDTVECDSSTCTTAQIPNFTTGYRYAKSGIIMAKPIGPIYFEKSYTVESGTKTTSIPKIPEPYWVIDTTNADYQQSHVIIYNKTASYNKTDGTCELITRQNAGINNIEPTTKEELKPDVDSICIHNNSNYYRNGALSARETDGFNQVINANPPYHLNFCKCYKANQAPEYNFCEDDLNPNIKLSTLQDSKTCSFYNERQWHYEFYPKYIENKSLSINSPKQLCVYYCKKDTKNGFCFNNDTGQAGTQTLKQLIDGLLILESINQIEKKSLLYQLPRKKETNSNTNEDNCITLEPDV